MKLLLAQTPKNIKPDIRSACKKLSESEPLFINIVAPSWALNNKCSFNAKRFSEEYGGDVKFGWDIAVWDNVLIDCIGHAIVMKNNEFIDVTPSKYDNSASLFIEDDKITFDYSNEMSRMPSKMIAISKAKEVKRLILIEEEIYNIKIKYPVSSQPIAMNIDDSKVISKLEHEKQGLMPKIICEHTHHNDPCVCGSNKKFRKCCQSKFRC